MVDRVARHYSEDSNLADMLAIGLKDAGKNLKKLTTADLSIVDEFHIRGRKATLELGEQMRLTPELSCPRYRQRPRRACADTSRNVPLPCHRHRPDTGLL